MKERFMRRVLTLRTHPYESTTYVNYVYNNTLKTYTHSVHVVSFLIARTCYVNHNTLTKIYIYCLRQSII